MNWLYPSFLRKTDHYLKINYPHIWRTRVHDFGWFSLVLGNVVAAVSGILIVGNDNVFPMETVRNLFFSSLILLVLVSLFWARRLLQFKIKSTNLKVMITTWLAYALCIVLMGLNVVTFISTIACRTSNLYPGEVVEADLDYMKYFVNASSYKNKNYPFSEGVLKEEYRTEDLLSVMARHGYEYDVGEKIYKHEAKNVHERLTSLVAARKFARYPIIWSVYKNHEKRSFYHVTLMMTLASVGLGLFFLPVILFLLSSFGLRIFLVSIFCTTLICMSVNLFVETGVVSDKPMTWFGIPAFVILILGITLRVHYSRMWNYIAGIFMLMSAVTFLMFMGVLWEIRSVRYCFKLVWVGVMICSLIMSLVSAWLIAKRNTQPMLH